MGKSFKEQALGGEGKTVLGSIAGAVAGALITMAITAWTGKSKDNEESEDEDLEVEE